MFPGGVNEMTALIPGLSAAPLTQSYRTNKMVREKLWNTSEPTAEDEVLSNRQSYASSFILWFRGRIIRPVKSHNLPQRRPILHRHLLRCYCAAPSSGISKWLEKGATSYLSGAIWEFCTREMWRRESLIKLLINTRRSRAEQSLEGRGDHEQAFTTRYADMPHREYVHCNKHLDAT